MPTDLPSYQTIFHPTVLLSPEGDSLPPVGAQTHACRFSSFVSGGLPSHVPYGARESRRVPGSARHLRALCLGDFSSLYPERRSPTHTSHTPGEPPPRGSRLPPPVGVTCASPAAVAPWSRVSEQEGPEPCGLSHRHSDPGGRAVRGVFPSAHPSRLLGSDPRSAAQPVVCRNGTITGSACLTRQLTG